MEKQLLKLLANILAIYIITIIFPSVRADSILSIVLVGIVLWLVNLLIRPLLLLVTLPINVLTVGLFGLIVNTWMVMLSDTFIRGLRIPSFLISFAAALLISAFNLLFQDLWKKQD